MKQVKIGSSVIIAFIFLVGTLISLQFIAKPAYAQDPNDIDVVKVLNQTSPVVRVGEFISFTIFITNNATFSLTHATLFDDYEESLLGSFSTVGSSPLPDMPIDSTNGRLFWTDLISSPPVMGYFPELLPGEEISLTIQFRVEHPPVGGFAIVNRAQIRDAVFHLGGGGDGDMISTTGTITGGRAPIYKYTDPPGQNPQVGEQITYTILLTNDGAASITETVVVDRFNPAYLSFITATPVAPTAIDNQNGVITWDSSLSPVLILPGQVVSVSAVFEILQTGLVNNRAEVVRVEDFFGNELAPGFDEVGIMIIADTPTPAPQNSNDRNDNTPTSTPFPTDTATPFPTQTPTAVATSAITITASGPLYLPETGRRPVNKYILPVLILTLLALGGIVLKPYLRP